MKKSNRMDIEHKSSGTSTIQFGELGIGDVFRLFGDKRLYMLIATPKGAVIKREGVQLSNGGRRSFSASKYVIQVKMVCSWVDMQP